MIVTDRNHGGIVTTTGKLMWPAIHYWWEICEYIADDENDPGLSQIFEDADAAQAAYEDIKARPGAVELKEDGLPYILVGGVEYCITAHDEQTVAYED